MNSGPSSSSSSSSGRLISGEQLANIVEQPTTTNGRKPVLVDCRRFQEYNNGHIKGAINLGYSRLLRKRLQGKDSVVEFISSAVSKAQGTVPKQFQVVLYGAQKPDAHSASSSSMTDQSLFLSFLVEQLTLSDRCGEEFLKAYPTLCVNNLHGDRSNSAAVQNERSDDRCDGFPSEATCILPFLYLGSEQDALSVETAKKFKITYLLNCTVTCVKPKHIEEKRFLRIPVSDSHTEKLIPYFPKAFSFLNKAIKKSASVLVHCLAGYSRSPTFVVAYLMQQKKMSLQEAYRFVKQKRPCVSPNINFWGQLVEFERMLSRRRQLGNGCIDRPLTLHAVTDRERRIRHLPAAFLFDTVNRESSSLFGTVPRRQLPQQPISTNTKNVNMLFTNVRSFDR
ncbi:dual specificity phosphatase, catalytic domain protein [Trichuris suis]|nr:dual specificity phosphatase, catalytic domain protein [Trichuris suis]